ncbi:MAG: hypothetical protein Kow0060_21730 [Methylohalobius crimeensis]
MDRVWISLFSPTLADTDKKRVPELPGCFPPDEWGRDWASDDAPGHGCRACDAWFQNSRIVADDKPRDTRLVTFQQSIKNRRPGFLGDEASKIDFPFPAGDGFFEILGQGGMAAGYVRHFAGVGLGWRW